MRRRDRIRRLLPAVIVLIGLLVVAGSLVATRGVDQTEAERDAAVGTSRALATPVLDQCARGADAGPTPSAAECTLAGQVAAQPAPTVAGLDTAQVLQLIRAELADLQLPPGQLPTPEMVRTAAAAVLTANPELFRGLPPTPEQVSAAAAQAVAAYFAANPVRDGVDGRDGDSPACLAQPAQCQGAQGIGLASLTFQRRDGTCVAVAVLRDPADGSTSEVTAPVADAVCEPVAPPTDPPPDPTPPADPTPPDSGMPPLLGN